MSMKTKVVMYLLSSEFAESPAQISTALNIRNDSARRTCGELHQLGFADRLQPSHYSVSQIQAELFIDWLETKKKNRTVSQRRLPKLSCDAEGKWS